MVATKKKSSEFGTSMDQKDLNKNLKHKYYQIPSRGEIVSEMAGALILKAWLITKLLAAETVWKQQQILCLQ